MQKLNQADVGVIDFLINTNPSLPETLPRHDFFSSSRNLIPYRVAYKDFPHGQYASLFWKTTLEGIHESGVHLLIPGIKDSEGWFDELSKLSWLSSLSDVSGFIGTIVDDLPNQGVELLYVFDKMLYFGKIPTTELTNFATGENRTLELEG